MDFNKKDISKQNLKKQLIIVSVFVVIILGLIAITIYSNTYKYSSVKVLITIIHSIGFVAIVGLFYFLSKQYKIKNWSDAQTMTFKAMFEYANDPQIIVNNLVILDCNTKVCELFGTSRDKLIGKHIFEFSAKSQTNGLPLQEVATRLKDKVDSGEEVSFSWKSVLPSSQLIDLEVVMKRLSIGSGSIVLCRLRNITHELESICRLMESEGRYREIVESANTIIIKFDLDGSIIFYNEFAERIFGYRNFEVLGTNFFSLLNPFTQPDDLLEPIEPKKWVGLIIKNHLEKPYYENWVITKNGKRLYIGWTSRPFFDTEKNIVGIQSIGFDRTEHKIIQDKLVENEKKLKLVFNSTTEGIAIVDMEGEIIEINDSALEFLGINQVDFKLLKPNKQLTYQLIPRFNNLVDELIEKGSLIIEIPIVARNGKTISTEFQARKIVYNNQDVILMVSRDITERKNYQHEVINAAIIAEEKERSRVAKELHDSVSPILSASKLYAQTLHDITDIGMTEKVIDKLVSTINESMRAITEISNNLSPHILENFGLIEAVHAFADRFIDSTQISFEIKSNISLRLGNNLEIVLYRVFTELINNSIKHSKASNISILIMKLENFTLEYEDNGIGFDLKKVRNAKSGMGLFNMNTRIESLNGEVKIVTRPGQGFKFSANIPLNQI
jgi:PAS domain S-box-containing protein